MRALILMYNCEQGTDIVWSFPLLHRDPDFWGEDAEEWRPERFDGRTNTRGYFPFNAGPVCHVARTCTVFTTSTSSSVLPQSFPNLSPTFPTSTHPDLPTH